MPTWAALLTVMGEAYNPTFGRRYRHKRAPYADDLNAHEVFVQQELAVAPLLPIAELTRRLEASQGVSMSQEAMAQMVEKLQRSYEPAVSHPSKRVKHNAASKMPYLDDDALDAYVPIIVQALTSAPQPPSIDSLIYKLETESGHTTTADAMERLVARVKAQQVKAMPQAPMGSSASSGYVAPPSATDAPAMPMTSAPSAISRTILITVRLNLLQFISLKNFPKFANAIANDIFQKFRIS